MPFLQAHKDIGKVRVGSKHTIVYKFTPNIMVVYLKPSCGCSVASTNNEKQEIEVTYKAQPIALQIIKQGRNQQAVAKQILVKYKDTDTPGLLLEETLTFKAIVF